MNRTGRILALTAALAGTGAIVGAVFGAAGFAVVAAIADGPRWFFDLGSLLFAALVGASIGAVVTPIFVWGLLRHVPLGRAIAQCAVGAIIGAVAGWVLPVIGPLIGAVLGFAAAAVRLRLAVAREHARITSGDAS